jgi:hypothetical protein
VCPLAATQDGDIGLAGRNDPAVTVHELLDGHGSTAAEFCLRLIDTGHAVEPAQISSVFAAVVAYPQRLLGVE